MEMFMGRDLSCSPSVGGLPVSIGEGYINSKPENFISSISGRGTIPGEREVKGTIEKLCFQDGLSIWFNSYQASACGSGATSFLYGYAVSLVGADGGASYTLDAIHKFPELAWDYIDDQPGVSKQDVLNIIAMDSCR
jgi:hypothetical protein